MTHAIQYAKWFPLYYATYLAGPIIRDHLVRTIKDPTMGFILYLLIAAFILYGAGYLTGRWDTGR